jgi:hypothetical protein
MIHFTGKISFGGCKDILEDYIKINIKEWETREKGEL